jgi:quinol monooxygenase YgiN
LRRSANMRASSRKRGPGRCPGCDKEQPERRVGRAPYRHLQGLIAISRLHSGEDPNIFYFYENWTDRAALNVHLNLPYQKEWFGRHDEFLSREVELRYFSMLSDYDK